eukprot:3160569-Rhodomonas_salina.1
MSSTTQWGSGMADGVLAQCHWHLGVHSSPCRRSLRRCHHSNPSSSPRRRPARLERSRRLHMWMLVWALQPAPLAVTPVPPCSSSIVAQCHCPLLSSFLQSLLLPPLYKANTCP